MYAQSTTEKYILEIGYAEPRLESPRDYTRQEQGLNSGEAEPCLEDSRGDRGEEQALQFD